jgi:hypothetical protein
MNRRTGLVSMISLTSILLCGAYAPTSCQSSGSIGPSNGEVIGIGVAAVAVVVVGVVVLVEVNKSHHTIKGCVSSRPGGLEVLNESDKKVYALMGVPPNVKVGDIIKVHGKKEKQSGAQEFVVEKMSRDYGPCKAAVASSQP